MALTQQEQELVQWFRALSEAEKQAVLEAIAYGDVLSVLPSHLLPHDPVSEN